MTLKTRKHLEFQYEPVLLNQVHESHLTVIVCENGRWEGRGGGWREAGGQGSCRTDNSGLQNRQQGLQDRQQGCRTDKRGCESSSSVD